MAYRWTCPACGKSNRTEEAESVGPRLCVACGHRGAVAPIDLIPVSGEPAAAAVVSKVSAPAPSVHSAVSPSAPFTASIRRRIGLMIGGAVAASLILGIGLGFVAGRMSVTGSRQAVATTTPATGVAASSTQKPTAQGPATAPANPSAPPRVAATASSSAAIPPAPATRPAGVVAAAARTSAPHTQPAAIAAVAPIIQPATAPAAATAAVPTAAPAVAAVVTPTTAPVASPAVAPPTTAPAIHLAAPNPGNALTDDQLERAIRRGVDFILTAFKDGELPAERDPISETRRRGLHALCVYTLITAGQTISDPRLEPNGKMLGTMIDKLKGYDLAPRYDLPYQAIVYARSLRAASLALRNRPDDRPVLKADVDWLVAAQCQGAFCFDDRYTNPAARSFIERAISAGANPTSYWQHTSVADGGSMYHTMRMPPIRICHPGRTTTINFRPDQLHYRLSPRDQMIQIATWFPWDNYNSQFAVMGVAAGADAGIAVPQSFWPDVMKHWQNCQREDGTWPYVKSDTTGNLAMTAGGLASVITAFDWSHRSDSLRRISNDPIPNEANRALHWMQTQGNVVRIPTATTDYVGLDAFTVGRAARTFGLKYIGGRDWYLELAQRFVQGQAQNGSWGRTAALCADTMIDTTYTTLFLAQGRPPVMMNKLRHDDADWQNHPHDAANLAAFTGRELERPLRWQIVDLSRDGADWVDAPILYITGQRASTLRETDLVKIKSYVESGGIVFTHTDSPGKPFNDWVRQKLAPAILPPGIELAPLPEDHSLYSIVHKLKNKPRLLAAGNTGRLMLIHSPDDLAATWDGPSEGENLATYQLGTNLYAYAVGKNPPRHRLIPRNAGPQPLPDNLQLLFPVARLKHAGNWDPEPEAWQHFRQTFYEQTGATAVVSTTPIADLKSQHLMAHLTGSGHLTFSTEEIAALRAYVEAGGLLLIDSFGGDPDFTASVRKDLLPAAFPNATFETPRADQAPLAKSQDVCDDLSQRRIRPFVVERPERDGSMAVATIGKGYVVVSPLDLTAGLLGSNAWGIAGYTPDYAKSVVKNLLVWAGARPR